MSNTITISESCLSALPPGKYHHSIFEGIDIYLHEKPMSLQEMRDEIEESKSEVARLTKREEVLEEQIEIARELLFEILEENEYGEGVFISKISDLIDNSRFKL